MSDQSRLFQAGPDPFGRMWNVQFRWLQTAISIRHADTVDVKFWVSLASATGADARRQTVNELAKPAGGASETAPVLRALSSSAPEEKVIALPHTDLLKVTDNGRLLTDPLCMRIAAAHLRHMIETTEDMDKTLVTLGPEELASYYQQLHRETVARH